MEVQKNGGLAELNQSAISWEIICLFLAH